MVQILPPKPSTSSAVGQAIGQGFQQGFVPAFQQQYQRGLIQDALSNAQDIVNKPNATPFDLASALISSTAGIPGAEKYVGTLFQTLLPTLQAKQLQNVNYSPEQQAQARRDQRQQQPIEQAQRQNLPQFGQEKDQFFPTNQPLTEAPGNFPQQATEGNFQPVHTNEQLLEQGKKIAFDQTKAGVPTTPLQGYEIAVKQNEENKRYNEQVKSDVSSRRQAQEEYGQLAEDELVKLFKPEDITSEHKAYFRRIGEEAAAGSKSEATIRRHIAKEADKFKNTFSDVANDISAPRFQNKIFRMVNGTNKSFDEATKDLRVKLKPLLDKGFYDTSRRLMTEKGYGPEEIEGTLFSLGDREKSKVNQLPEIKGEYKTPHSPGKQITYKPLDLQRAQDTLKDILNTDPNANLILLRKQFEDRGYDWRVFRNSLNSLMENNEIKDLSNDQRHSQLHYLDSPPLSGLESILHGLHIIGR